MYGSAQLIDATTMVLRAVSRDILCFMDMPTLLYARRAGTTLWVSTSPILPYIFYRKYTAPLPVSQTSAVTCS